MIFQLAPLTTTKKNASVFGATRCDSSFVLRVAHPSRFSKGGKRGGNETRPGGNHGGEHVTTVSQMALTQPPSSTS